MTVSYFLALESRIPMTGAERRMDAAQAALYPHLTKESGAQVWQGWVRQSQPPINLAARRVARQTAQFTLNGQAISADALEQQIAMLFGGGAVA